MRTKAELTWLANKKRAERRRAIGKGLVLGIAMGIPAIWFAVSDPRPDRQQPLVADARDVDVTSSMERRSEGSEESGNTPDNPIWPGNNAPDGVSIELISAASDLWSLDPAIRARAIWVLGTADLDPVDAAPFEEMLIHIAKGDTADDRRVAIAEIGRRAALGMLSDQGRSALYELLTHQDPEVVADAARATGAARDHGARNGLLALLDHEHADVQVEAAIALDLLEDSGGREKLVALAYQQRTAGSAIKAFRVLDRRDDHRITEIAKDLLASDQSSQILLASACHALGDRRADVTKDDVSGLLKLEPAYRLPAEYALAANGHAQSLASLQHQAGHPDGTVNHRITASILLLKLDSTGFRPIIESWLDRTGETSYRDQMMEILESEEWEID